MNLYYTKPTLQQDLILKSTLKGCHCKWSIGGTDANEGANKGGGSLRGKLLHVDLGSGVMAPSKF